MQSFKTNIKCGGCVAKVKPQLDKLRGLESWRVDLESPDRILTIEGDVKTEEILEAIAASGYRAERME